MREYSCVRDKPRRLCGLRLVAAAVAQDLRNRGAFGDAQVGGVGTEWLPIGLQCQMFCGDESAFAQNGRTFQHVVKLAHVSWPGILEQRLSCITRQTRQRPAEGIVVPLIPTRCGYATDVN